MALIWWGGGGGGGGVYLVTHLSRNIESATDSINPVTIANNISCDLGFIFLSQYPTECGLVSCSIQFH